MAITTEEFISTFHSLSGTTIGERRKNLFLLMNKTKQADCVELDFASIQPKTLLEEKFKLEVMIYFRRSSDLMDLLKCENPILIHRILKTCSWFLEELSQNVTGEQLVTLVLSQVSFNTKVKIIHKLALCLKNPQQADLLYDAIEKKYGLYLASKLLPSCSSDLILNCVKSNRIKFTPRQLLIIVKKYPHITEDILNHFNTKATENVGKEYKKLLMFLVKQDTVLFLKLYDQYNLSFHLGWRITDKFILANKEKVVHSPNTYLQFLHNKQIAKSLKDDFGNFYTNLFPKTVEQFQNSYDVIFSLLKHLPSKMKNVNLLLSTFEGVYGSQLWDHSTFVTPELLEMLGPDERENRMKVEHKPSTMSEDEWSCYLKTENSIPLLKKRISLSSVIKARAELMSLLVKTCKINKDMDCLAEMCKYVVSQHRNDHMSVRLAFLRTLKKSFQFESLGEQHWLYINELIRIFTLNDETFYHHADFIEGYIHYRLINNLPITEQLTELVKLPCEGLNIIKSKPQYEKHCLLAFAEVIPQTFTEADLRMWNIKFVAAVIDWNRRHQSDHISLLGYANAIQSVKEILQQDGYLYNAETVVTHCLRLKIDQGEKSNLLSACLSNQQCYNFKDMTGWLIKYDPVLVLQNIEIVTQGMLKTCNANNFFWKYCNNYSHLEIPLKAVKICLNDYQKESDPDDEGVKLKSAISALSCLMSADEFLKFMVPYYPSDSRIDTKSDEAKKKYKLQQAIGASLKNISPPSQALQSILLFCKGDYFRVIQRSLYSLAGNVNEYKLVPFFSELLKRPFSVGKHVMHLTLRVLDKEQVQNVLNLFMETEKNASVRKFILKCSFNFFVRNPSDYSWNLVKLNLNTVDENDKEVIAVLMQFDKIPSQYFTKYVLFTWDVLCKLADSDKVCKFHKAALLQSITSDKVQLLSADFCKAVIESHLFKCAGPVDYFQAAVQLFTCKCIIHCTSEVEQEEHLKSSFALLKDYINATWHNADTQYAGRSCTTNYLKGFCQEFLDDKCSNKEVLVKFVHLWNNCVKPHEAFDEYLQLQFTLIYVEKLPLPEVGRRLGALCDSLGKAYGPIILGVFYNKIKCFMGCFIHGKDECLEGNRYILIENVIVPDNSLMRLLLVILLFNDNYPTTKQTKVKYNRIIDMLQSKHDKEIQMYLHRHFKSISN